MTMPIPKKPLIRAAVLATVGLILVVVACLAPTPMAVDDEAQLPAVEAVAQDPNLAEEPTFTPYTVRPDITNRAEVARAMEENYPPLLRDAGIGGTVTVWFYLDETGAVRRTQINESSGHEALDDAALRVAGAVEFTAALNRDKPVPVWISLPITFSVRSGGEATARVPVRNPSEGAAGAGRSIPAEAPAQSGSLSDSPTFTPYTVRPEITNREEVARAMQSNYPPLLRDAGIGGTITVWFFLDKTGAVQTVQLNESSGHQALDDAALRVAEGIEFTPALNRDESVPVWISLPITFTTR